MSLNKLLDKYIKTKSFWNWGPLLFTGFYLLPTIFNFSQLSTLNITVTLLFYIAFIVLYIFAVNKKLGNVTPLFSGMVLVCVSASFFTPGTSTLFGFTAYIAGFSFTKFAKWIAIGCVFLCVLLSAYLADVNNPEYFLAGSLILSIALFSFGAAARKEHIHKMREHESAQQLEQLAAIAERERIARDLHDILGHSLSSIALKSELASKLNHAERYAQANTEIDQVAELARQLLSDVRNAVSDLKQLNIHSQLNALHQRLLEHGFDVIFKVDVDKLPASVEGVANLIIKEAVTNLMRHCVSKQCEIDVEQTSEQLNILITNPDACDKIAMGNGLNGIKERAEQLGGSAHIQIGQSFKLNVSLPLYPNHLKM
ncbi:sensor histidine kinase [Pseudoalteromonas sp. KS88]|uniref:sensor histidine kinase n=1 Tax=Pseudoalteromonas sp. KS88 TaxID=2109918 RepID=UPI0010820DEA|nr:sensor histidine kinase [Pseudoalteromonas sp. KS88]TGE85103.1 sensor histidine kinase [Pseudoalteromonas sp. KS88]